MNKKNLRRISKGMQRSVKRSDHIITISEFSKKEIMELLNVPEEKISIVYSAPVNSKDVGDVLQVREKFGIEGPYVLYVGTIEPRKNLSRLIRAFDKLKTEHNIPHKLVLAGGNGWNNEEIYETAKNAACKDDIVFTGYLTEKEKNTLYSDAEVFVFPSLYEGFGMPPLEAMGIGCPIVCANAASLPEVVGDAAQLVEPTDEDSIADGIWRVLSDKEYAAELVKRGYERAEVFTWDASAEKLLEICKAFSDEK